MWLVLYSEELLFIRNPIAELDRDILRLIYYSIVL